MNNSCVYTHANIVTFNPEFGYDFHQYNSQDLSVSYGVVIDGAIGVVDGKISWIGNSAEVEQRFPHAPQVDCMGKWLTPALIDCHTHLVYAGNRSNEFEARLTGVSYSDIARQGGGILSTVNAVRKASFQELYEASKPRLEALISQGVGTVEIKSGYGLDFANERKMLLVAQQLEQDFGVKVQKTYLAAHALPKEFENDSEGYIEHVCQWLKKLHQENLVDAVDGFLEKIAFNKSQISRVFDVAKSLGLPVKLHAEQLSDSGGAGLVSHFDGLSADHIEYLNTENISFMAKKGVVGVLLPTAYYVLRETKLPPIEDMRRFGVKMAVSTDSNPGTSPSTSILLAMNMACTLFSLTPSEALAGTTVNAAKALGLAKKGQIKLGFDADFAIWNIDRPADLSYLIGMNLLDKLVIGGSTYPPN